MVTEVRQTVVSLELLIFCRTPVEQVRWITRPHPSTPHVDLDPTVTGLVWRFLSSADYISELCCVAPACSSVPPLSNSITSVNNKLELMLPDQQMTLSKQKNEATRPQKHTECNHYPWCHFNRRRANLSASIDVQYRPQIYMLLMEDVSSEGWSNGFNVSWKQAKANKNKQV